MRWRELDGYDWCLIETPETGPYLSLTLGYGLMHEPIEHFGTLQLTAGMLQAELSRPIEITPGRVSVPETTVGVDSDTMAIAIRGDVETLHAAWLRLADIFAGRQPLDAAPPVEVTISAAPRDVTSRFGLTSVTFAASKGLEVEAHRDPRTLLHYLNPAGGNVRTVMCTNTEALMTSVFAPPVTQQPHATRGNRIPGNMRMPENQHVSRREGLVRPLLPTLRLPSFMNYCQTQILHRKIRHLGQFRSQLRSVIITVHPVQDPRAVFE